MCCFIKHWTFLFSRFKIVQGSVWNITMVESTVPERTHYKQLMNPFQHKNTGIEEMLLVFFFCIFVGFFSFLKTVFGIFPFAFDRIHFKKKGEKTHLLSIFLCFVKMQCFL